jgi:ribosome biogenesis protein Nip4
MTILFLKKEEIEQVASVVDQILLTMKFENIIKNKALIMVHNKRKNIYLIDEADKELINSFSTFKYEEECIPVFLKIKLGFWIKNSFRIGIESLPFFAPLCKNPIILPSKRQVTRFIYGKNIEIPLNDAITNIKEYIDGSMQIVCSKSRIPLGYAKLKLGKEKVFLKNIIDIGIYLRSEKTAF